MEYEVHTKFRQCFPGRINNWHDALHLINKRNYNRMSALLQFGFQQIRNDDEMDRLLKYKKTHPKFILKTYLLLQMLSLIVCPGITHIATQNRKRDRNLQNRNPT